MKERIELALQPKDAEDMDLIKKRIKSKLKLRTDNFQVRPIRKSIDARSQQPIIRFLFEVSDETAHETPIPFKSLLKKVNKQSQKVVIVGAGPAGYFAALELLELGCCPIIFDRGKDVRTRRRDLRAIQQFGIVDPNSNYCFGEGGAGTYSDGKLYTRSKKRGKIEKTLRLLVEHGAASGILVDAHPHIGSNKLPKIIANIRETILEHGGEIHFNSKVVDILADEQQKTRKMQALRVQKLDPETQEVLKDYIYEANAVILATGHSARDIFHLLDERNIRIESKPFAIGVRIEHPQALIDEMQYRQKPRDPHLPAASYSLTCQVDKRGVFSFCMCPGGLVVPAATAPNELVVNGMSLSRRDSPYANSGFVTAVELEDMRNYESKGVFKGLEYQAAVEKTMFQAGDGSQKAPAQRVTDFMQGKLSSDLPKTSYIPGIYAARMDKLLPKPIVQRLRRGLQVFGKRKKGYYSEEAQLIGVESRTSSPIRIPRDPVSCMHHDVVGLFPCGEGAGYAGGIMSAAMDGQRVARAVAQHFD